jgi:succinoglycan biosynthesis transport protein ExoP
MTSDRVPDPVSQSHPQADHSDKAILTGPPRRKPFIYIGLLLGAALIGAGLWFVLARPKSMVRSLVFVSAKDPYILIPKNDGTKFEVYQRAQAALVKSRFVISAALKQREPEPVANLAIIQKQPDPIQWLEKELQVDFSVSPETMRISLRGDNTQEMIILVNAVTKAYLNEIVDKEKNKRLDRMEQLKKAFARFDEYKQRKKRTLDDLIRAAGTGNSKLLELKKQIASVQLTDFIQELSRVRLRKLLVLGQIKVKKAGEKADKEGQVVISKLEEEAAIFSEQEKLIEQQLESLAREDSFLNRDNLDLESLNAELLRSETYWKKVVQEIDSLEIEQGAPSRITLPEEAIVVGS